MISFHLWCLNELCFTVQKSSIAFFFFLIDSSDFLFPLLHASSELLYKMLQFSFYNYLRLKRKQFSQSYSYTVATVEMYPSGWARIHSSEEEKFIHSIPGKLCTGAFTEGSHKEACFFSLFL